MRLRCFFDPITDQCVGIIAQEDGQIKGCTRFILAGEVFVMQTPRYDPINFYTTISRDMDLNVYPLGADLNHLLFLEEQYHAV